MKKLFITLLAVVLMTTLIIGGRPAPLPASPEVIELIFSSFLPDPAPLSQVHLRWADLLEKQSGGKVKVNRFFAGSLLPQKEVLRGVERGIADIAYHALGPEPGLFQLNWIARMPFIGWGLQPTASAIYQELWSKFPELREEYRGLKVFTPRFMPAYHFHTTKKVVRIPSEIKGMKIIARGEWASALSKMGGAAVALSPGDYYMSLERGLAEGVFIHFPFIDMFKLAPVLPYHTIFGKGGCGSNMDVFVMNLNTWNSLPPDIQKLMEDLTRWAADEAVKIDVPLEREAVNALQKKGHTFINLSPQEIQLWSDAAKPMHEEWIKDTEAIGKPARAVYEETMRLIEKYNK